MTGCVKFNEGCKTVCTHICVSAYEKVSGEACVIYKGWYAGNSNTTTILSHRLGCTG